MSRRVHAIVALLAAVACSAPSTGSPERSASDASSSPPSGDAAPTPAVSLVRVATLEQPIAMAVRSGDPGLYVAEKTGRVVRIVDGRVDDDPVLDVSAEVSLGSEQGLLGIAFAPDGAHLFINLTDVHGDTRIESFAMRDERADVSTRRELLFVAQPFSNHNGGHLVVGPDGYLYVGLGDGGAAGDPGGNAQSLSTLLGKMLRIDPTPGGTDPYAIPHGNPFVDREGVRPEIWAYGLRNPWRYAFDDATGDLWIGDVGQDAWEEIDRQPGGSAGGENYGWDRLEGSHAFEGKPPNAAVPPVYEYGRDGRVCAVTGGTVYRGEAIPSLRGTYVFADHCLGLLETLVPRSDGTFAHADLGISVDQVASFGEDAAGELYVLSLAGGVYRLEPG